jgi:hypothetical protein
MPMKAEYRARYPNNWREISKMIRKRAGERCQGSPAYPDCRAKNGAIHPHTGSIVVLTVGHINHMPEDCRLANLKAWCQRCHLTYDARHHAGRQNPNRRTPSRAGLSLPIPPP